MSTGMIENWGGTIADIGPMYPFVGSEMLLTLVGIAFWIAFHVIQSRAETRTFEQELGRFGNEAGLREALDLEADDTSETK